MLMEGETITMFDRLEYGQEDVIIKARVLTIWREQSKSRTNDYSIEMVLMDENVILIFSI
jgi:hypothetical protein